MGVTYTTATGATYVPISTTTLGSNQTAVTLSSFGGYTDLRIVVWYPNGGGGNGCTIQFNSDTATNYSDTIIYGNGTSALSTRDSSVSGIAILGGVTNSMCTIDIFNYSNTTTYKTALIRGQAIISSAESVHATVGLWRGTPATITTIKLNAASTFNTNTTVSVYGILGA